ncbi:MAG: energy transducer TonB [Sphingomonadaceae bacterium]
MKFSAFILAATSLIANSAAAASNDVPIVLQPSSPWDINYGKNSCRLSRIFGSGEDSTAFYLEKYDIGSMFTVLMAGKTLKHFARPDSIIRFSNGGGALELTAGQFGSYGPSVVAIDGTLNPDELTHNKHEKTYSTSGDAQYTSTGEGEAADRWSLTPAQMQSITWIEISHGKNSLRLNTGPIDKPIAALDKCVDDLVSSWGLNPSELRTITHQAIPDVEAIKSIASDIQQHYPSTAIALGSQATISVRLIIDTSGHVSDCQITNVTEAKDFDDYACKAFEKSGKFEPARDKNGNPIKSSFTTNVVYRMR